MRLPGGTTKFTMARALALGTKQGTPFIDTKPAGGWMVLVVNLMMVLDHFDVEASLNRRVLISVCSSSLALVNGAEIDKSPSY
jgi:hypothetical protein